MRLIVGLGNPGREYVGTRHNVGFEAVEALACRLAWISTPGEFDRLARTAFDGLTLDGLVTLPDSAAEKLLLLKPTTYMNLSGRSVQAAMAFFQVAPADIMVVLDELALPCGKLRIRPSGSAGGHNGLRDIERALGTSRYPRLRIGIDPPPPPMAGRDYVLGRYSPAQRKQMDEAIPRACDALRCWMEQGIEAAMSRYNADVADDGKGVEN